MSLTEKEQKQLWYLLEKANVLWQYFEKQHIAEDLTDKQWEKFIEEYQDGFANGTYYTALDCVEEFTTTE